jgi:hypothetical protein
MAHPSVSENPACVISDRASTAATAFASHWLLYSPAIPPQQQDECAVHTNTCKSTMVRNSAGFTEVGECIVWQWPSDQSD